ncbi:unnamed protein product [Rotaria sp. Silwood1]|nr:unnamed protein product [Rotaria sp. Silwood1]CAF1482048.1 unnamed protein product [Rotaria sp. Silwood1]CAF3592163.1 unnamed protein product [Rotaria sp. Silwood1]CAF3664639.1 unnamed protein product [Rotaria sp. Silwood1]CAF4915071.1 unnamed protein product [Rotaria sp. Silwood1]
MSQKLRREYQRAQCVTLSKVGMTCLEISTIVNIPKSSVQRALKSLEETGNFHDRRRSGRPQKLNDRYVLMLNCLTRNDGRYPKRSNLTYGYYRKASDPELNCSGIRRLP